MNFRFLSFLFLCGVAAGGLSSCEFLKEFVEGPPVVVKKVYAPGELKADEIEKIALSEVGKREGTDVNFRSDGVQDREDIYYVSVVARPYRPDGRRTVVVNEQGEVVQYLKGNRLPKYREEAPSSAAPKAPAVRPLPREAVPVPTVNPAVNLEEKAPSPLVPVLPAVSPLPGE